MRIAVIGHAGHITIGRVSALPGAGQIAHLESQRSFAGGGGGIGLTRLVKSES